MHHGGLQAGAAAFREGSYFTGSWEQGAAIRFLSPSGDCMVAEFAKNRPHEFVSIRHLGVIENGVEDTTSDTVRAWAPAYENHRFAAVPGGCRLTVTLDSMPEREQYMADTAPATPTCAPNTAAFDIERA